jgi:hypothetical protein
LRDSEQLRSLASSESTAPVSIGCLPGDDPAHRRNERWPSCTRSSSGPGRPMGVLGHATSQPASVTHAQRREAGGRRSGTPRGTNVRAIIDPPLYGARTRERWSKPP